MAGLEAAVAAFATASATPVEDPTPGRGARRRHPRSGALLKGFAAAGLITKLVAGAVAAAAVGGITVAAVSHAAHPSRARAAPRLVEPDRTGQHSEIAGPISWDVLVNGRVADRPGHLGESDIHRE